MTNFSSEEQTTKRWNTKARERNGSGIGPGPITTLISRWKFINNDSAGGELPAVVTSRRLAAMLWQCGISSQPGFKVERPKFAKSGIRKWENYYYLRDGVRRERKRCDKMQVFNSKLESDIAKAKLLAARCIREQEEQIRERESLENVCKKIQGRKDEIRELKTQLAIVQEEMENEKKMLQLTEAWREEQARMKLVEAASIVEDKYCELNSLIVEVKAFLRSTNVKERS